MKIFITGSNGLLGQKLLHKLRVDNKVDLIATSKGVNRVSAQNGYTYISLDITDEDKANNLIEEVKPDVVINTAAMTKAKNPQTNLTRTEEALLSPSEKIIAGRT